MCHFQVPLYGRCPADMDDFQLAVSKLDQIFNLVDVPEDTKKTLLPTLIDGAVTLAGSRMNQKNPQLAELFGAMDKSEDADINSILDEDTKNMFVSEIMQVLNEYISELCKTVPDDKKTQIMEIWEQ